MWNTRQIEEITHRKLIEDFGQEPGKERFALYLSARKAVVEEILQEIKAVLPEHTDHGPEHIANVLDNAGHLLGIEHNPSLLSGMELYCLILSILFHDVGNIFGREEHQRKVATVYDYTRSKAQQDKEEKLIVLKATEAHSGTAPDGSKDTLKHLDDVHCNRQKIKLRQIAAILRFADELAEGPQRTSLFMQMYHGYSKDNEIYHQYANITSVGIDRESERISLTYNIDIDVSKSFGNEAEQNLRKLLEFTYKRINKLNQERKYAKYYCDFLSPFKKTTITFNFWIEGYPHSLDLPQQIPITDVVVPGEKEKELPDYHDDYKLDNIISKIHEYLTVGASK